MKTQAEDRSRRRRQRRIAELLEEADPLLARRLRGLQRFSASVRASEYHLTNACNLRCDGCWFFAYGHDGSTRENRDQDRLETFVRREREERRVNSALLIGGEPTLVQDRIRVFQWHMRYVTVSTNGVRKLPVEGFEDVAIALTIFGGGALDDELRGRKPDGGRLEGLFETALDHYRDDERVGFVYAVSPDGIEHVEDTVRRIAENGNRVTFNYYTPYGADGAEAPGPGHRAALLAELLRVRARYPRVVMSHPYYLAAMVTGQSHWARFGYDVCPSLSAAHPAHRERLANGNPALPHFAAWAADLETLEKCCTSGRCDGCRDSQAVQSWLLVSLDRFLESTETLRTWVELAEAYWTQFVWSPYHPRRVANARRRRGPGGAAA